jgi:hypothetical protein
MQSFGVLKRVVHIVTTGIYRVNPLLLPRETKLRQYNVVNFEVELHRTLQLFSYHVITFRKTWLCNLLDCLQGYDTVQIGRSLNAENYEAILRNRDVLKFHTYVYRIFYIYRLLRYIRGAGRVQSV